MPEAGQTGIEFELVVRALDQFGNVDETFERDVTLDNDGVPPGMVLSNKGSVKLSRGLGRLTAVAPKQGGAGNPSENVDIQ